MSPKQRDFRLKDLSIDNYDLTTYTRQILTSKKSFIYIKTKFLINLFIYYLFIILFYKNNDKKTV